MAARFLTLGLAIVARDEDETLPNLLASIEGAFDQVALLDTGSTDRTVEVFESWAKTQDLPLGYKLGAFDWVNDFAAARNAADDLLSTDWIAWADCDEEIRGASHLRPLICRLPPEISTVGCPVRPVPDDPRVALQQRLYRRGAATWSGRVHEQIEINAGLPATISPAPFCWVHTSPDWEDSDRRDAAILEKWLADEPDNLRALHIRRGEELAESMFSEAVA